MHVLLPRKTILCLLLLWGWGVSGVWAQDVAFEAEADPSELVMGDYFELRFTLRNARGTDFVAPDLSAFDILMGPSQAFRTTIINGQASSEFSISYTLRPRQPGTWTIGPARIRANGRTLHSNAVTVVVHPPVQAPDDGRALPEVFVEVWLSDTVAYTGQEVIAELKLYTTRDVDSYSVLDEPELRGAWVEPLRRFDTRVRHELRGGRQYATKVLRRLALFPQQTGRLDIGSWRLQLGVVEKRERGLGFFFNTQVTPMVVESAPRAIDVQPLPAGAPPTFTGAVGHYAVKTYVQPTHLTTDEALQLTWTISGVGDIKRVEPPQVPLPADSFDIYEPRVVEETIYEDRGLLRGKKVIEVLAIPRYPGWYRIDPAFAWFDPDSLRYLEVTDGPWLVEVKPGQGTGIGRPAPSDSSAAPAAALYPMMRQASLRRCRPSFWGSMPFWVLSGLPFALGLAGLAVLSWRRRRPTLDEGELRHQRARKLARQRLAKAERHLKEGRYREWYDELAHALIEYVAWRLRIPMAELTKANVDQRLSAKGVPDELRKRYRKLLELCEQALYAGMADKLPHAELRDEAVAIISELERYLEG